MLCMVVICAVHTGNLTASLAVKRIQWPFHDLKGLSQADDYSVVLLDDSVAVDILNVNSFVNYFSSAYKL